MSSGIEALLFENLSACITFVLGVGVVEASAFREQFARNFNALLDRVGAPGSGVGRTRFVATEFQVTHGSASKWLSGATAPDPWRFEEIASRLNATVNDLIGSAPAPQLPSPGQFCATSMPSPLSEALGTEYDFRAIAPIPPIPKTYPIQNFMYMFTVDSNEMEPYVCRGDLVLYAPVKQVERDGEYVLWSRDRLLVRRISRSLEGDRLNIASGASKYPDTVVPSKKMCGSNAGRFTPDKISLHGKVLARILVRR